MDLFVEYIISTITYAICFLCGLAVTICIGVVKNNFGNNCPLFMDFDFKWEHPTEDTPFWPVFSREGSCVAVLYGSIVVGVLYPFLMIFISIYVTRNVFKGRNIGENYLCFFPLLSTNGVCLFLNFSYACIISIGRGIMCSNYYNKSQDTSKEISCFDLERRYWDPILRFETNSFLKIIVASEIISWINVVFWILQFGLSIWRTMKRRHRPN